MNTQLVPPSRLESSFTMQPSVGMEFGFGMSVSASASALGALKAYAPIAPIASTVETATSTHAVGLACSPCAPAKKQDRKNNWHGRPLIGRGGLG